MDGLEFDDEANPTKTSELIKEHELYIKTLRQKNEEMFVDEHIRFLRGLSGMVSARGRKSECSSIWNPFYFLGPCNILRLSQEQLSKASAACSRFISSRCSKSGAFSGFPYDNPNIVSQYAVICSIAMICTQESYEMISRELFRDLLLSLKQPNGSFLASIGEEADIRSTFSGVFAANVLNISCAPLFDKVIDFTLSCQNYDGGFGPFPGAESHGGFVYCAVGILHLLGAIGRCKVGPLMQWIASRQSAATGGFQGRTNKLSDSCYSWWIGSAARMISDDLGIPAFWNEKALTSFIICSAQSHRGGFCDSPPNDSDPFHTLFALSGLCIAGKSIESFEISKYDPILCCPIEKAAKIREFFLSKSQI